MKMDNWWEGASLQDIVDGRGLWPDEVMRFELIEQAIKNQEKSSEARDGSWR